MQKHVFIITNVSPGITSARSHRRAIKEWSLTPNLVSRSSVSFELGARILVLVFRLAAAILIPQSASCPVEGLKIRWAGTEKVARAGFKPLQPLPQLAPSYRTRVLLRADFSSWELLIKEIELNWIEPVLYKSHIKIYKKAQLSLTNPRDAKVCQKLLQFNLLTTLSLTILAYLHSFSCCCVRNLRNPAKFTGVNRKPILYDFLLVTNSNFGRICYRFRDIDA